MKLIFFICLLFFLSGIAFGQKATPSGQKATLSGQKTAPDGSVVLQSGDLLVKIDRANGLPFKYLYRKAPIRGADSAHLLQVVICRLQPRSYITLALAPSGIHATAGEADIHYIVPYQMQLAASFHVKYKVDGASLVITMEDVEERKGFELIETSIHDLTAVREEEGEGWLAQGMGGVV